MLSPEETCSKSGYWINQTTNHIFYINQGETFPREVLIVQKNTQASFEPVVSSYSYIDQNAEFLLVKKVNNQISPIITSENPQEYVEYFYRKLGEYYTDICRTASDTIWKWFFILNAGGFLGTITLLVGKGDNYKNICIFLFITFLFGILSIILSVSLEHKRYKKQGDRVDNAFKELGQGKITTDKFLQICSITKIPWWVPNLFEWISLIVFLLGLIVSISYLMALPSTS
jgi:uncharacterized membrane protein YhaH (DUF805 family)